MTARALRWLIPGLALHMSVLCPVPRCLAGLCRLAEEFCIAKCVSESLSDNIQTAIKRKQDKKIIYHFLKILFCLVPFEEQSACLYSSVIHPNLTRKFPFTFQHV